jgi:Zn-dependent protease
MSNYRNPGEIIFSIIAIVISFTIHEYSHAFVSTIQGDDTPRLYGRLTLNPLAHVDIAGFITLILFKFGWAKPVPISSKNYKNKRLGIIFTSLAGPLSNFILAFLTILIAYIFEPQSEGVLYFMIQLIFINIGLAVFNLIPVPPLDGSKIIAETIGGGAARFIYRIERFGIFIVFMLLWLPPVGKFFSNTISGIYNIMESIAIMLVR